MALAKGSQTIVPQLIAEGDFLGVQESIKITHCENHSKLWLWLKEAKPLFPNLSPKAIFLKRV